MEANSIITILAIVLPLLGAGIGFLFRHSIEKKKELTSEITKERREIYQQFVNLIIGIWSDSKSGKKSNSNLTEKLYEFYKKYVLYASPGVIITFSDYFQFLYDANRAENAEIDTKNHLIKLTTIMAAMRKDLGLSNKNLGENGEMLLRAMFTDYDEIIRKHKKELRQKTSDL